MMDNAEKRIGQIPKGEEIKIPENLAAPEDPEVIKKKMLSISGLEVDDFKAAGENGLTAAHVRAEKIGANIDAGDEADLNELGQRADETGVKLQKVITEREGEAKEGEIAEPYNIQAFINNAQLFLEALDTGTRDSRRESCDNFLKPFETGEAKLSSVLKDPRTVAVALEAFRNAMLLRSHDSRREPNKEEENILYAEIASSLNYIDMHLRMAKFEDQEQEGRSWNPKSERRFKNNAFLVISEALKTEKISDNQKISQWLAQHFSDIASLDSSYSTSDGRSDTSSEYAIKNILQYTNDQALIAGALEIYEGTLGKDGFDDMEVRRLFAERIPSQWTRNGSGNEAMARYFAKKLNLNERVVSKWSKAKVSFMRDEEGKDIFVDSYETNICAAMDLEKMQPGSARLLFEKFGIAHFGRYEKNMLLRQLEMVREDVPYGVVAYPEADWNGAFFQNGKQLKQMADQLNQGGYEARIIEVSSQLELARRLLGFHRKYSKEGNLIDFMLIAGHGTPASVQLGENSQIPPPFPLDYSSEVDFIKALKDWDESQQKDLSRKKMTINDLETGNGQGIRRAAREWFGSDAPVVFISCRTGVGGGIAETASDELGFDTIAPDKCTNVKEIGVQFNDSGKPGFNVEYYDKDAKAVRYTSKK